MASQPIRSSSSMAAPKATAPTTLGEPASSRSGGSVQITSSRSTRSTAPPPARNGSPVSKVAPRPDQRARPERRVELVAAEGDVVGPGRQGPVRRQLGRVEQDRDPALVRRRADLLDRGSHPVTFEAPVSASRAGVGPSSSTRTTSSVPKVPSRPHSTQRRVATRAQGNRLAWCSTTVVTTTSSGPRPEAVGQVVDGLGRVAHQHHHVVAAGGPAGEAVHAVAGLLVGGGGPPGLVAGAAVHARVPGQERRHPVGHRLERRCRGGAVEVAVGPFVPSRQGTGAWAPTSGGERRPRLSRRHITERAGDRRYPAAVPGERGGRPRRPGGTDAQRAAEPVARRQAVSTTMSSELRSSAVMASMTKSLSDAVRLVARRRAQRRLEQREAVVEVGAAALDQAVGEHHQAAVVELELVVLVVAGLHAERWPGRHRQLDRLPVLDPHRRGVPGRGERDDRSARVEHADERGGESLAPRRQRDTG